MVLNAIPDRIKHSNSLKRFQSKLKTDFLNSTEIKFLHHGRWLPSSELTTSCELSEFYFDCVLCVVYAGLTNHLDLAIFDWPPIPIFQDLLTDILTKNFG